MVPRKARFCAEPLFLPSQAPPTPMKRFLEGFQSLLPTQQNKKGKRGRGSGQGKMQKGGGGAAGLSGKKGREFRV